MAPGFKSGGRKKGTPNKKNIEIIEQAAGDGELPLEYMLRKMNDPEVDDNIRNDMAKAAAPYCHARITAEPGMHVNIAGERMTNGHGENAEYSGIRVEFVRPAPQPDE